MTRHRAAVAAWLLSAVVTAACGAAEETRAPAPAPVASTTPTGRIRGVVTLRGSAAPARSEPVAKDQHVCGRSVPVTRIAVGKNNGVKHTFVYLDGVKASGTEARPRLSVEIGQKGCEYAPHSLVFPPGASLDIVNDDPLLHNIHARETTDDGLRTVFNIAQPVRGQRTALGAPFGKPGVVALTCEAGHPWMTAYILVSDHPYVAVSNDDGEFVIDGVPVGTYPIRMWHEGVSLKRIIASLQQYEYEAPYEATDEVVVPAGGEVVVNFAFGLRSS
jgi:hypothetical protein